ncbi:hypothetical protein F5Y19DRAFT_356678 [Xylariaceae sp. FL1651]|nr:hypothetical protein F5Y19DRAFT_356678 [Xylariaceae sp. FL1651]
MSSSGAGSRQKSCNACVKSKRRCDKSQPACGRCAKQRYLCVYGGQMDMPFEDSANAPFSLDCLTHPDTFIPDSNGLSTPLGTGMELISDASFQLANGFSPLLAPMPGNGSFMSNMWPSQLTGTSGVPLEKTLTRKDYSTMAPVCDDYAPWQLTDPSTKAAFTMSVYKKFHVTFAESSCTLYIHRYLYKDNMPRWMLQAFSVCLLYTNQTVSNRGVVLRVLHENVTDLKNTASAMTLTPQEKLARVHALMFYQTIRMFDGDITLGQQADDDMALLESWNKDLCKVRDNLDDLAEADIEIVRQNQPESWERWIFAESLRRTCIMCFAIETFWDLLKTRTKSTEVGNWANAHRWTLSTYLWDAQTSFDFFRAWKEKPLYIMSAFNFDEFLKTGTGDALDDFAVYFLTIYFGVNEIKTFCYETSGRILTLT